MKPHRLTLTNSLVLGYGLHKMIHHMYSPRPANREELEMYHTKQYIDLIERKTREQDEGLLKQEDLASLKDHYENDDCPVFGGMYHFFAQYAGASLMGARALISGKADIAINWSGGLHHAKKNDASGFCYVNDIVLAILELLRFVISPFGLLPK
jgi:acetoin utilization deacetylase AcuC-like enzyme